jgi:hypothetical protein
MIKPKKLPADPSKRAKLIGDLATGQIKNENSDEGKNIHAVELGKLGGRKGGLTRAANLSKKRRSEIAKKAAEKRWKKKG